MFVPSVRPLDGRLNDRGVADFAQLSANLGRNLMEGPLGILAAMFEAASSKTRKETKCPRKPSSAYNSV
jgi:hypothetical protein